MHRIDGDDTGASLPTPQAAGTAGYFKAEGDVPPTQVTGDWLNAVQEELAFAIEESGLTLDKTDNTLLYQAIKGNGGRTFWRSRTFIPEFEVLSNITATKGVVQYRIERTGTAYVADAYLELGGESRGLKVNSARVRYHCPTAFDGTITSRKVDIYHRDNENLASLIGTVNLTLATSGSFVDLNIPLSSNPILGRGETLYALLVVTGGTSGSTGILDLFGVDIQYWGGFD